VIRHRLKVSIFVGCFLAPSARAVAQERRAEVEIAGPLERVVPVEQAVQEPLSRLPIQVSSTRAAAVDPKTVIDRGARSADAFVRVWIDLVNPNQVTIYFVDSAWERILVRHFPVERGLDDVEREEIAQIIRSSVEALLSGATIGITREEARQLLLPPEPKKEPVPPPKPIPKQPEPKPAPPPPPPAGIFEAGAFYEAELYANTLWHGPGAFAGAGTADALSLGGRLTLQYRVPALVQGDRLGARIQALAIRALGRVSYDLNGWLFCGALGLGADVTSTDPTRVAGSVEPEHSRWDVAPVARGLGGTGVGLGPLGFWAIVGADADLVKTRFVAERDDGRQYTAVDVALVRPFFGIDVTLELEPPK
jgi:hypothetical protein